MKSLATDLKVWSAKLGQPMTDEVLFVLQKRVCLVGTRQFLGAFSNLTL
jgi:hypothetical protein